jgi:hypothetical protein
MEANLDALAAPPSPPAHKPGGSQHSLWLRILQIVHLLLVPVMVFWYLIWNFFAVMEGQDYDPLRLSIAAGLMSGLFALDIVLKVAALIALGRAPQRVAWYLAGAAAVTVGYFAVIFLGYRSMELFAMVPLLLGGLLVGECIVYGKLRRANPGTHESHARTRADIVVVASGAVLAGLLASWIGISQNALLPDYTFDDGPRIAADALFDVLEAMESSPEYDETPDETSVPGTECDEVMFTEWEESHAFESGSFEDYKDEIRSIWTELGYEIDESVAEKDGLPYLTAMRSDGVHMALMMGDRPANEGKVVLAAYSGCVIG